MRYIIIVSRYILALLFIFSGFVKGVDPFGFEYKLTDYFRAFNIDFLEFSSLFLSIVLCASELLIGLMLLFGIKLRLAVWGAFLFMVVFTPLTFVLAVFNPVHDCGCFGDAIKLTNWETFFKNLFFLAAALVLLMGRSQLPRRFVKIREFVLFLFLIGISLTPSIIGYTQLPLIDFRPFKIGVSIPEAMKIPEGAPVDEYKTTLFYQKDGIVKEFDENNIPWQDSTWKFVDSKSILVKKGYTPSIESFNLLALDGQDLTDSILKSEYFFLLVSSRLDKSNTKKVKKFNELHSKASELGYGFACITASADNEIANFVEKTGALYPFLNADEIMLKTMIRSNPGLILLHKGMVIGQWHYNHIPDVKYLSGDLLSKQILLINSVSNNWLVFSLILLISFLLVLSYLSLSKTK